RFLVSGGDILRSTDRLEVAVLRPDAWVIKACTDAMGRAYLSIVVLEQVTPRTVQHSDAARHERRGVFAARQPAAPGSPTAKTDVGIIDDPVDPPQGVAAAADAGQARSRQTALLLQDLRAGLPPDD